MTACDLSAVTKPWEVQSQVNKLTFPFLSQAQVPPKSRVKVNTRISGSLSFIIATTYMAIYFISNDLSLQAGLVLSNNQLIV